MEKSLFHEPYRRLLEALSSEYAERLAVRSSALNEDQLVDSQAGRYLSVIDVQKSDLVNSILSVWASAHRLTEEDGIGAFSPMAVLVQPLLEAEAYGVASSVDPLTGDNVTVIELGRTPAAVTAGEAVAERYVVSKDLAVYPQPGDLSLCIAEAIRAIAKAVRTVKYKEGCDFEIEFGCRNEEISILQARPMTALPPQASPVDSPIPAGNWILDRVHYPRPTTPLFESIFAPAVSRVTTNVFAEYGVFAKSIDLRSIKGWPYVRVVPLSDIVVPALPGFLIGALARLHPRTRRRIRASAHALTSSLSAKHIQRWEEKVKPSGLGFVAKACDLDLRTHDGVELKRLLREALQHLENVLASNYQPDFAHLIPLAEFIHAMRDTHNWTDAQALELVRNLSQPQASYPASLVRLADHLRTVPGVNELLEATTGAQLAAAIRTRDDVRSAWDEHHRRWSLTLLGYDLDDPTLGEVPELERRALLAILSGVSNRETTEPGIPERFTTSEQDLLRDARKWFYVREEGESVKAAVLGAIRLIALEVGRRLADTSAIQRPDLALFLTVDELSEACTNVGIVRNIDVLKRVRDRNASLSREPTTEFGASAVRNPDLRRLPSASRKVHYAVTLLAQNEILSSVDADEETLRGRPASTGVHTGRVNVIEDPTQLSEVAIGDIIVAQSISSIWATGFWTAGALITETGGLLSHSAIVAREMGIPAVIGVPGATSRLSTGDIVTVDGSKGIIFSKTQLQGPRL